METIIKKQIGRNAYTFVFQGKNLFESIMESQKLSFDDIKECGCCKSDNLILSAHKAQGFDYTEIRCQDCRASLTFGKRKDDPDTYFLRRKENGSYDWKAFKPENVKDETNAKAVSEKKNDAPALKGDTKQVKKSIKCLDFAAKMAGTKTMEELRTVRDSLKTATDLTHDEKLYLNAVFEGKKKNIAINSVQNNVAAA